MPNKFDRYREALVVETETIWPEELSGLPADEKERIQRGLHDAPGDCAELQYTRLPTGFVRSITATSQDLERLQS